MNAKDKPSVDQTESSPNIQGEGDYESTRRYNKDTERFLKSADVTELARKAAPKSKEEAAELARAEELGRSHSAGAKDADTPSATGDDEPE